MDLYETLELKPNASEIEIRKAYHRLAKKYHPDKNSEPDANDKFQKINSAYEILINQDSRREYLQLNTEEKTSFSEILEKIIKDNINSELLGKYGINLSKNDFDYVNKNLFNFFQSINVGELLSFFKKGIVPKKNFNNTIDCSESESGSFDETCAEYYYNLPIKLQKINKLDIRLELNIKLSDIALYSKRKIKIKRNMEDETENCTFLFYLTSPYIVFYGGGDMDNGDYGNLIIKLNLPNNLLWTQNLILIQQPMTLYEMIYGLDLHLDLGEDKRIHINDWVPSRDGYLIEVLDNQNQIKSNIKLPSHNIAIKLYLDYESTPEKEELLKQYFS